MEKPAVVMSSVAARYGLRDVMDFYRTPGHQGEGYMHQTVLVNSSVTAEAKGDATEYLLSYHAGSRKRMNPFGALESVGEEIFENKPSP